MRIDIVPVTPEIVKRFGEPIPRTVCAVAAVRNDEVLGMAGIYTDQGRQVMFAKLPAELLADRRTIVRGIRAVKVLAKPGLPVHALADHEIEGSDRLLTHMGFEHIQDGVYEWRG